MSESPLGASLGDAYSPPQIARLLEDVAVRKMRLGFLQTFTLGILGGAFISLGAMFYTVVVTGSGLVALVYWLIYIRGERGRQPAP